MKRLREALASLPPTVYVDLLEGDEAYLLVMDVPGATAGTVDVDVRDGVLEVEARRGSAAPEGFTYRRENRPLFLDASIPLPRDAVGEGLEVSVDRGVLEVRVPKRWGAAAVTVPVEDA